MKIKSDLRLAAEDLVHAFQKFVGVLLETALVKMEAILEIALVKRGIEKALPIYLGIGFIGFAWGGFSFGAFIISGFKSGGMADWLRDFVKACPWLAFVWLVIIITSCWVALYKEKKQRSQTNQIKTKVL